MGSRSARGDPSWGLEHGVHTSAPPSRGCFCQPVGEWVCPQYVFWANMWHVMLSACELGAVVTLAPSP